MKLTINGQVKEYTDIATVSQLINKVTSNPTHLITELNGRIVPSNEWEKTTLNNDDVLELVTFVGGG